MAMLLKPGMRLFSNACATEMVAVRAPADEVDLTIGGLSPTSDGSFRTEPSGVLEGHGGGATIGKRYVDEAETIELLCTKAGDGLPALGGEVLQVKAAKPLPSSD